MNSKVKVEANQNGQIITESPTHPTWGWIRVTQNRNILDEQTGIIKTIFCSALVQGKIRDLRNLGWTEGQELEGVIIFKDSMTPYRKTNPDKDYKVAGESGVICTLSGEPIYRKYFYSINPNAQDVLIAHDDACRENIRQAYQVMKDEGIHENHHDREEAFAL